uniref:P40 n=1 Tax=Nesodiprion zhejiangensis nucleopolyhedrovirus TaxID=3135970 RepID=A0AAN0LMC6_9BACU
MSKRDIYILIEQTKRDLGDDNMRAKFWTGALEYFCVDSRIWSKQEITDAISLASTAAKIKSNVQLTTIAAVSNNRSDSSSDSDDDVHSRAKNILLKQKEKRNLIVERSLKRSKVINLTEKPYATNAILTTLNALKDMDSTPQKFTVGDFIEGLLYISTPDLTPFLKTWVMTLIDASKQDCNFNEKKEEMYNNVLKDIRLLLTNDKYYTYNINSIIMIQKKMQSIFRMPLPQLPRLYQIKTDLLYSESDKIKNLQTLLTRKLQQMATTTVTSFLPQLENNVIDDTNQKYKLSKNVNISRVNYTVLNQLYSQQYTTSLLTNTPPLHDEWQQKWLLSTDKKQQRVVRRKLITEDEQNESKKARIIPDISVM